MTEQLNTSTHPPTYRPAAFFDRDGVLIRDVGYPSAVRDVKWIPGAAETVRFLHQAGYFIVIVSNQSGVARGYFSIRAVEAIDKRIRVYMENAGGAIDASYYCPFHEEAVVSRYRVADHQDRKPNPGMLLRAFEELKIDVGKSFLVGDKESDVEAARRAGIIGYRFSGGNLHDFCDAQGLLKRNS